MADFNGFRGAAKPLDDIDLPRLGYRIGVGEDEIHAVIDVETAGGAWDAKGRPKLLFEPHRFWRNLGPGPKRDRAAKAGLAYPSWGEQPYPKDSYPRLIEAMAIDETAALKSASWGLGQILGENHAMVGYDTVQEMVLASLDDADKHLEMVIAFILSAKLDGKLRAHDWAGFARGYNGPQYAKHGYHTKLEAAFKRWAKIRDTPWSPADEVTRVPVPTPRPDEEAAIGHNGGPPLSIDPVPAPPPNLSPIEQANKAVGAGTWAALASAIWTAVVAANVLPVEFTSPEFQAAVGGIIASVAAAAGAYRARDKRFQNPAT